MKFALLNILLLAFSTLKATAMPSTVTKDAKAEEHKDNQLAIRTVEAGKAVEAQNLGPWAAVIVGAAVGYAFTKAADYAWEKFTQWRDAGYPGLVDSQLVDVMPEKGEDLRTLMTNYVNNISQRVGPDVGVLLIQKDAITGINLASYNWMPVQLQKSPDVPGDYQAFDLLYAMQGTLNAQEYLNGNMALYQMGGALGLGVTNGDSPSSAFNTFYFGKH